MKRILYVGEDCCERFLEFSKREKSLDVTVAKNGKEGIRDAKKKFDLIVVSIRVPDISSWNFLRKAKRITSSRLILLGNIPVSRDRINSLKQDGFVNYLVGPLSGKKLFYEIKKII